MTNTPNPNAPVASESYQSPIQWYPGHMAKWDKKILEHVKQVDVVLQVLDARLPLTTWYHELTPRLENKPILTLLNKASLADPQLTKQWQRFFEGQGHTVLWFDALNTQSNQKKQLISVLQRLGKPAIDKWVKKGLKPRPVRLMVVGMPNVGKSTLINTLVGKKKVQTGHKAGVTRSTQWVRLHEQVELLDSPGILPMSLNDASQGSWLALVSSIGEAAFDDDDVARLVLAGLQERKLLNPTAIWGDLPEGYTHWSLEALAAHWNLLKTGGVVDTRRATQRLLTDLRQHRYGRMSFERPERVGANSAESTSNTGVIETSANLSSSPP